MTMREVITVAVALVLLILIIMGGVGIGTMIDKWSSEQRQERYFACLEKVDKVTCDRIHYRSKL